MWCPVVLSITNKLSTLARVCARIQGNSTARAISHALHHGPITTQTNDLATAAMINAEFSHVLPTQKKKA